ncbi:unnamed protein product [Mytilus edulis]|uniref:Reverse transcriptase/retrotransposon-derived protein RNase H-like domain-containing protein n=1 Tax=Mytilus edulis TaxID=6550 RepID=A0A8S3TFG3_MYTED|nr:unnamed protein product [Mytilus edulis]
MPAVGVCNYIGTEGISSDKLPSHIEELFNRSIVHLQKKETPLHKACDKGTKFIWTENCQLAFNSLKEALTTPPILVYPVTDKTFILDTDASNYAVGAVLSQEHDGREHVIAYMSKALNKHEISYCTTRKELLAVIIALKNFHPYVYGRPVLLRTDNAAVSWLQSLKDPTGQVARWLQTLGTYNF